MKLNDEQLRALSNAAQLYESWREVTIQLSKLPGGMYWRVIHSREYLYQYEKSLAGIQQTRSLGPRSTETEQALEEFQEEKRDLDERLQGIESRIKEFAPVWRALRLPSIDTTAGKILRQFDQLNLVGRAILVVGTYALKAYEVDSATNFSLGMDATEDLDFTLLASGDDIEAEIPRQLLLTLKQVDSSFIVSPSSSKTAVNKRGYKVDLLSSKSLAEKLSQARPWKPEALDGQEWLVLGKPVDAIVTDFEGWPVPVSAPDPRYFALHKIWLSRRPGRPGPKRAKDERQGDALLRTIREHMHHYPINEEFVASLPDQLREHAPQIMSPRQIGA